MKRSVYLLLVVSLLGRLVADQKVAAQEAGKWISLQTPHFWMDTTGNQARESAELLRLEEIRNFFAVQQPFGKLDDDARVHLIAFQSKAEYSPYTFRSAGGGYYTRTTKNDYILFQELGAGTDTLLAHEFTHFVVVHAGLKLPIWLNEGLAEVYSTLETGGKEVVVGLPPARHLELIRRLDWIPWDALFEVDVSSPQYNESDKVTILYVQSWALTHMLSMDERYAGHFRQFVQAVSDGQNSKAALQSVYRKSMADIDSDLRSYVRLKSLPQNVRAVNPSGLESGPKIGQPAEFDLQFALADVLASRQATMQAGQARLVELSARFPERPEPEETLAMLAFQQNRKDEAKRHLSAAIQRHSKDGEIYYQYAALQQESGLANAELTQLFGKALELNPDLDRARLALALFDYEAADFETALPALLGLKAIPAGSEYDVNYAIAQCYLNTDKLTEARTYAEKARLHAETPEEKQQVRDLLANLASNDSPALKSSNTNLVPVKPK